MYSESFYTWTKTKQDGDEVKRFLYRAVLRMKKRKRRKEKKRHLRYMSDSLIYVKKTKDECFTVKEIMHGWCMAEILLLYCLEWLKS